MVMAMTKCQQKIFKDLIQLHKMVWIKSKKDTLGVIFIDGYVPSFDDLKTSFKKIADEYNIPKMKFANYVYHYVYRNKVFSDKTRLNFFRAMVWKLNEIFCPHKYKIPRRDESGDTSHFVTPCAYYMIGSSQKLKNYLTIPAPTSIYRSIESELNIIEEELACETKTKLKAGYLQNIIYYRIDNEFYCDSSEQCCKNWIETLNFRVKGQNEYTNSTLFQAVWRKLLKQQLLCQFIEPNIDFINHYFKRYLSEGYT